MARHYVKWAVLFLASALLIGGDFQRRPTPSFSPAQYSPTMWLDASDLDSLTNENLWYRSADITASWTNIRTTDTGDTIANPYDGATTGDTLIEDSSATTTHYVQRGGALAILEGVPYRVTGWAKKKERHIAFRGNITAGSDGYAYFDLDDCTVQGYAAMWSDVRATDAGNGWCRLHGIFTPTADANAYGGWWMCDTPGSPSYSGNGSSGVYVYGYSWQRAVNNGKYVDIPATTLVHGLDPQRRVGSWFDKVGNVEPFVNATDANKPVRTVGSQGENRLTNSDDMSNATYWTVGFMTATGGQTGPDGGSTAVLMTATASTNYHYNRGDSTTNVTDGVNGESYTASAYLKNGTQNQVVFILNNATRYGVNVDLANGTIDATENVTASSIEDVGSGWYRVSWTFTSGLASGQWGGWTVGPTNSSAGCTLPSYATAGTETFYVYGMQVRHANTSPAYVATTDHAIYSGSPTGLSGIRFDGADDLMTSTATESDIFKVGGKTIFFVATGEEQASQRRLFETSSGITWILYSIAGGAWRFYNDDGSADFASVLYTRGDVNVINAWHDGTNISLQVDGGAIASTASGNTAWSDNALRLGHGATEVPMGRFNEIITYNKVLSSAERANVRNYLCKKWGASC